MDQFDLLHTPLEGQHLIEASAGTGKTYTIAGLYVRLLLEKRLSVDQILVVTFTEAATEELRDRVRKRIGEALDAFTNLSSEDAFLSGLVKKTRDTGLGQILLTNAMRCFDEAAVFTIHGFCQRILQDRAFECSSFFNTELVTDQRNLWQEVVDDFWRIHLYPASSGFIGFVKSKGLSPHKLANLASQNLNRFHIRVLPETKEMQETDSMEETCFNFFVKVKESWLKYKPEVENILLHSETLNRKLYKETSIPGWVEELNHYLMAANLFPAFHKMEKFGTGCLKAATKKGYSPPYHPFFELIDEFFKLLTDLEAAFNHKLLLLKKRFLSFMREQLVKRKEEQNIRYFDDLLLHLHAALEKGSGRSLAQSICCKYKAALIDEFQDTDPIQYAIFKTIYSGYSSQDNILFLIGDPKQAIYSFRGADIFAYMAAAKDAEKRYTLGTNWRSEPRLIKAINTIFANKDKPFVFEDIPFQPVKPAAENARKSLIFEGQKERSPFKLWFMTQGNLTQAITKGEAEKIVPEAVTGEIGRLLLAGRQGRLLIDSHPVSPGDIAVLVRTNRQSRLMQEALQKKGIPSVLYSSESLFASREAGEMMRILMALAEPSHEGRIKAAMVTDILGIYGQELANLINDETAWEGWLEKFRFYFSLWTKRGFIIMARTFMAKEGVRSRLLAYQDGERRLTNLLHCVEVLHQAGLEKKLGVDGLIKWLAKQIQEKPDMEEYQIRLETDEKAVKLVTIHKSKGLEYPIVFCPFCWSGSQEKNGLVFFHDPEHGGQATLDLGSEKIDLHTSIKERETLAENLRLLYVALTRAQSCCYLVWGKINNTEPSAPAYLFHSEHLEENKMDANQMLTELDTLVKKADGSIEVYPVPPVWLETYKEMQLDLGTKPYCRLFSGDVSLTWRITSFSSLVAGKNGDWAHPGLDQVDFIEDKIEEKAEEAIKTESLPGKSGSHLTLFDFPRGAKAGTCLHKILEKLDYTQPDHSGVDKLIQDQLTSYGIDLIWTEVLSSMLKKVLMIPLIEDRNDFTLASLAKKGQVKEMEFYFPVEQITSRKLGEIFAASIGSNIPASFSRMIKKLDFTLGQGMLKGYIDLVFCFDGLYYLIDWKSNYLGPQIEDYRPAALKPIMEQEFYFLQYHLYTVALHKYLARCIHNYNYQTHFGGVFYIFLRGINPSCGSRYGIFSDRPPQILIEKLDQYLKG